MEKNQNFCMTVKDLYGETMEEMESRYLHGEDYKFGIFTGENRIYVDPTNLKKIGYAEQEEKFGSLFPLFSFIPHNPWHFYYGFASRLDAKKFIPFGWEIHPNEFTTIAQGEFFLSTDRGKWIAKKNISNGSVFRLALKRKEVPLVFPETLSKERFGSLYLEIRASAAAESDEAKEFWTWIEQNINNM